jgi:hypothetical protein
VEHIESLADNPRPTGVKGPNHGDNHFIEYENFEHLCPLFLSSSGSLQQRMLAGMKYATYSVMLIACKGRFWRVVAQEIRYEINKFTNWRGFEGNANK